MNWQPIETAPLHYGAYSYSDDRPFAVLNSAGFMGAATYVKHGEAYYETPEENVTVCSDVTHWMPLPPPPEAA